MPPRQQAWGAIPLVLYAKIAGLRARHEITVVTLTDESPGEMEAIECLRGLGIEVHALRRAFATSRWRLAATWCATGWPRRSVWLWEPKMQQLLDGVLSSARFDVINIEDNAMGMYRYGTDAPRVFTEIEVARPGELMKAALRGGPRARSAIDLIDGFRWPRYQRAVWRRFEKIQVFSPDDREAAVRIAPGLHDRLHVIPYGILPPAASDSSREEPRSVLFVGSFMHPPNVDAVHWLVTDIMPILRKVSPGVRLDVVGDDPRKRLAGLAAPDIHLTGYVPEIEPYMDRAAIVIAPLRLGGGQRMKVLQSMAMGKAVVTTPCGVGGLAVNGCATPVLIANDAAGLAEAAATLLGSPSARRDLGARAREFVLEHHSAFAYGRRMEELYEEARAGSGREPAC